MRTAGTSFVEAAQEVERIIGRTIARSAGPATVIPQNAPANVPAHAWRFLQDRVESDEQAKGFRATHRYLYTDVSGHLVLVKVRFTHTDGRKDFRKYGLTSKGGWKTPKALGLEAPLYRLHTLVDAQDIWLCNGEKAADRGASLGLTTTCLPDGEAKKWYARYGEPLKDARRVIVPIDNDEAGRKHEQMLRQNLTSFIPEVVFLHLPGLPPKGDLWDFIEAGGTASQLHALVAQALATKPVAPTVDDDDAIPALPRIRVNGRELRDISKDTLSALCLANDPPQFFVRSGLMVSVVQNERGAHSIEEVKANRLRGYMTRVADFYRVSVDKKGKPFETATLPPLDVVMDILSLPPASWGFPMLDSLTEAPVLRPDGTILSKPGYDAATGVYYAPSPDLLIPLIPDTPCQEDVAEAVSLIDEIIADFPFSDVQKGASRAGYFAAMLTPATRPAFDGNAPLGLFDAPQAGNGKTLLAETVAITFTGNAARLKPAPRNNEEEWRKSITSTLMEGDPLVIYDNVDADLKSSALALALTAGTWNDRLLGVSRNVSLPQRASWLATGNNFVLGGDLPRRCYWVRIDAGVARPFNRGGWRHPNLKGWVSENRGRIIAALLTMARAWFLAGKPAARTPVLGSFENWCRTIGGILEYAGVEGFLGNLEGLYEQADPSQAQWSAFVHALRAEWTGSKFTANDVVERMRTCITLSESLPDELEEDKDRGSFQRRLGHAFLKKVGRRFGDEGLYITKTGTSRTGVALWKVVDQVGADNS